MNTPIPATKHVAFSSQAGIQSWTNAITSPIACPAHPGGCDTWADIQASA